MKTGVSTICAALLLAVIALPVFAQRALFFGYEKGEERRYLLGPPEALPAGESATWSIYLRELVGEPAEGIFELTHEWHRARTRIEPAFGTITGIRSAGELRVNAHGFPLMVEFRTERAVAGIGLESYTILYRYEGGSYRKQIRIEGMEELVHTAMIRPHRYLDRSVPSGLDALAPMDPNCSIPAPVDARQMASVGPPTRPAGLTPPPIVQRRQFVDRRSTTRVSKDPRGGCRESLFANPGLISLMLPELWEQGTGEREFLLMTPAGSFGMPATGGGFDFTRAASPDTNSVIERLRYLERVEVEVGSRQRDAWKFDRMGDFEAIYVDDDGVVLRVDFSGRSMLGLTGNEGLNVDPAQMSRSRLSIRLLFPSEY